MIVIGILFVSLGYSIVYWGANNIAAWKRASGNALTDGVDSVPFPVLIGVSEYPMKQTGSLKHPVPFPYTKPTPVVPAVNTSPGTGSGTTSPPSTGSGGANINPNYPGGPGPQTGVPSVPGQSV